MTTWPPNMTIRPLTHAGTTRERRWANFSADWSSTLDLLARELDHLGAARIVLELDVTERDLRIDGMPRANAKPATPAVGLSFESDYGPLRYATDVFNDWQANLRAIALGLEALRKVDRYGISKRGEQYTGWKALPATASGESPEDILIRHAAAPNNGLGLTNRQLHAQALRRVHPDIPETGDRRAFDEVQGARRQLEQMGDW